MLYKHRPETYTQAYHAGSIISMLENTYPNEKIPSLAECMVHYYALRELLGDRLWFKMKASVKFRDRIILYEKLAYQPFLPRCISGGSSEFCMGYSMSHNKSKRKRKYDVERSQHQDFIEKYLLEHS